MSPIDPVEPAVDAPKPERLGDVKLVLVLDAVLPMSELGLTGLPVSVRLPLNGLPTTPIPIGVDDGPDSEDEPRDDEPADRVENRLDGEPSVLLAGDESEPPIGASDGDVMVPVVGLPSRFTPVPPTDSGAPVDEVVGVGLQGADTWLLELLTVSRDD